MLETLKKAAEILVEYGYASDYGGGQDAICGTEYWIRMTEPVGLKRIPVQLFANTLEGRTQLDVVENWLHRNHQALLIRCKDNVQDAPLSEYDGRQKRLARLEWCLRELP